MIAVGSNENVDKVFDVLLTKTSFRRRSVSTLENFRKKNFAKLFEVSVIHFIKVLAL